MLKYYNTTSTIMQVAFSVLLVAGLIGCKPLNRYPEGRYIIDLEKTTQSLPAETRSNFLRANVGNVAVYDFSPDHTWSISMMIEGKQFVRKGSLQEQRGYFECITHTLNDQPVEVPKAKLYRESGTWIWKENTTLSPNEIFLVPYSGALPKTEDFFPLLPYADAYSDIKIAEVAELANRNQSSAIDLDSMAEDIKHFRHKKIRWRGTIEKIKAGKISIAVGTLIVRVPQNKKSKSYQVGQKVEVQGVISSIVGHSIILYSGNLTPLF